MFQSRNSKIILSIIGVAVVALVSFAGGAKFGIKKVFNSSQWGPYHERNFLGTDYDNRRWGMMGGFRGMMGGWGNRNDWNGRGMMYPQGISGEVVSVSSDSLVIKDSQNKESTVRVNDGTFISRGRDSISLTDLKTGDKIAVMGKSASDGAIIAHYIRIITDNTSPWF